MCALVKRYLEPIILISNACEPLYLGENLKAEEKIYVSIIARL